MAGPHWWTPPASESLVTPWDCQRQIRRQFATYVPPQIVKEMTQKPGSFKLGGELRDLSMLFSDLRGFTTLSKDIGAEDTARLMNAYLTEMTKLIFDMMDATDAEPLVHCLEHHRLLPRLIVHVGITQTGDISGAAAAFQRVESAR